MLAELEEYVQRKLSEFEETDKAADKPTGDFFKGNYRFTVVDSSGEEVLQSVKEFKRSYFPDDTLKLRVHGYIRAPDLDIDIVFTRDKDLSKINVSYNGKSARETATGIASEILLPS